MTQLLKSQDRDTNNPGAQMDLGPEEILLMISRNPEQTRARLEAVRQQREADAKKKIAAEASKLLRAVNARFRTAERTRDATEAARLRGEAEERLKHLARTNTDAWPWAPWASVVRDRPVLVVDGGGPLFEGLRVGVPSPWNPEQVQHAEFGVVGRDGTIGFRAAGEPVWTAVEADEARFATLRPEHYDPAWPPADDDATLEALDLRLQRRTRISGDWAGYGWHLAPDAWAERMWALGGDRVLRALAELPRWAHNLPRVPVIAPAGLRVVTADLALDTPGVTTLAPTEAGWQAFLAASPGSGLTFTALDEAARWWWSRSIPRTLLSAGRAEGELAEAA